MSATPVAAVNGQILPAHLAGLSLNDAAIVQGATVTERIRTFAHQLYLLDEHLDRLRQSLHQTGIAPEHIVDQLTATIAEVVLHNSRLIEDWQDLSIAVFVSPGRVQTPMLAEPISVTRPTICVSTTPIPSPHWAALARDGVHLVTPSVRQIGSDSLSPTIKHRSRLHWFVADEEARQVDPTAAALLLDAQGHITETATGNIMLYDGERLLTPRPENVLGGISQRVVTEIACALGIETVLSDLTVADVLSAEEAFLTSTGYCLLPVTRLNCRTIGSGRPRSLVGRLRDEWSKRVGVDIFSQYLRAAGEALP